MWELSQEVDRRTELVTWRQGRCLPYGEGITFWALGEIVKAEAGILETDNPSEAHGKLELAVAEVVADEAEHGWFTDRLAPLVGAQEEGAGVARQEAFTAWRRYLEAIAAQRPLVLVIEDLHWADAALLDFVEDLLDWAAPVPLLVVGTARPELYESRAGLGRRTPELDDGRALAAHGRGDGQADRRLARTFGAARRDAGRAARARGWKPALHGAVRAHAGGARRRGDPRAGDRSGADLARLDTLSPQLKSLVQDASVVGKVFWTGALAAMGDRERGDVLDGVRELLRREFVRPARVSSMRDEEEFSFWHVLVRDVAYQQIPRGQRAEKHVRAAEWVEQAAQERVSDHAEILVYHYDQAIELRKAAGESRPGDDLEQRLAGFLVLAGDRAMQLDIDAAEAAYRRALELSEGPARAAALVKIADALQERAASSKPSRRTKRRCPHWTSTQRRSRSSAYRERSGATETRAAPSD